MCKLSGPSVQLITIHGIFGLLSIVFESPYTALRLTLCYHGNYGEKHIIKLKEMSNLGQSYRSDPH